MEPEKNILAAYLSDLDSLLERYFASFPEEKERLAVLRHQVDKRSGGLCSRKGLPGHLTASALVLSRQAQTVLLIKHNFLQRWLQPGGHMEACEDPVAAARRELKEEVGPLAVTLQDWQSTMRIPIDIDSHKIPFNEAKQEPEHLHHDLQYLFILDEEMSLTLQQEEVSDFRWAPLAELERGDFGQRLARTAGKMLSLEVL